MGDASARQHGARAGVALGALALAIMAASTTILVSGAGDAPLASDEVAVPDWRPRSGPETRLGCEPAGCEVWRVESPSERPVLASADVVVSLDHDEIIGYAAEDGRTLWRIDAPADVNPASTALSEHGLALTADTRFADGADADTDELVVTVREPLDGTRRFDLPLDVTAESGRVQVAWMDGNLVIVGDAGGSHGVGAEEAGADDHATRRFVMAVSPDGEVVWSRETAGSPVLLEAPRSILLMDDAVTRIDPVTGGELWRVPNRLTSLPTRGGEMLTIDHETDRVDVVDFDDGGIAQTISAEGAQDAYLFGPWAAIGVDDELRVHDLTDGRELFRHRLPVDDDGRFTRGPSATVVGGKVAVMGLAISGDDGVELATYTHRGELEATLELPFPAHPVQPLIVAIPAGDGSDVVHVASRGGPGAGMIVTVDLAAQEIINVEDGRWAHREGGILVVGLDNGLRLIGPAGGELRAHHATHVASTDPLVVHGVGGILRLDDRRLREASR